MQQPPPAADSYTAATAPSHLGFHGHPSGVPSTHPAGAYLATMAQPQPASGVNTPAHYFHMQSAAAAPSAQPHPHPHHTTTASGTEPPLYASSPFLHQPQPHAQGMVVPLLSPSPLPPPFTAHQNSLPSLVPGGSSAGQQPPAFVVPPGAALPPVLFSSSGPPLPPYTAALLHQPQPIPTPQRNEMPFHVYPHHAHYQHHQNFALPQHHHHFVPSLAPVHVGFGGPHQQQQTAKAAPNDMGRQPLTSRLSAAAAAVAKAADVAEAIASLQRLLSHARVTDGKAHAAWLVVDNASASLAVARFAAASGSLVACATLNADVVEHRGRLAVAALDHLLLTSDRLRAKNAGVSVPPEGSDSDEFRSAAKGLVLVLVGCLREASETHRGCIALMRVLSAIHHDRELVTSFIAALTPLTAAFLCGPQRPYLVCHIVCGLRPPPASPPPPSATERQAIAHGAPGAEEARAEHVIEFLPWTQAIDGAEAAGDAAAVALLGRDRCDAAVWHGFISAVLRELRNHLDAVLEGRQTCVALWHVFRRIRVLRYGADGVALLAALASDEARAVWPPPAFVSATAGGGSREGEEHGAQTMPPSATDGGASIRVTPLNALCRSTAGRTALVSLFDSLEGEAKAADAPGDPCAADTLIRQLRAAFAALVAGAVPPVDAAQERTLKLRPGMEAAATLETRIAQFLELTAEVASAPS
uniref:Uncharacterized protein n=1 Tax=Neobodo designis TaxID=312471 RepID=A0A7S1L7N9_NEODS|mmetsp:Transcript_16248/g.50446  ORF Transcript_16248/g.50446 Transcript_16248/m.50446 type:complete len:699 (+) Transcript_16248:544-2640(+)